MYGEGEGKSSGHEGVWVRGLVGAAGSMFSSEPGLMHGEGEGDGRGEDWNCGSTVAGGGMGDNRAQTESERKG